MPTPLQPGAADSVHRPDPPMCGCMAGIIVLKGNTQATFDSCSFVENRADISQAGAILAQDDASVRVTNSNFRDNVAM